MTMPLLLDTCAAIWIAEDEPLAEPAISALDEAFDAGLGIYVSPITAWEIGLLTAQGRLVPSLSPAAWFRKLLSQPSVHLADMSPDLLIASSFLPHGDLLRDPADRIIATTAREHGCRLVTRDRLLLAYAAEGHVRAVAC